MPQVKNSRAAQRFKVDENQIERNLILLLKDETQASLICWFLLILRKVYVRSGLRNDVFAVEFNTRTAAKTDDWIDMDILTLEGNHGAREG